VTFFDLLNKPIQTQSLYVSEGKNVIETDVNKFTSGVYLLQIDTGKEIMAKKVIIE
jgi:hypothetical protein